MLSSARFGRNIFAVGGNREAAVLVGIRARYTKFLVYGMAAMFAALAGILFASRMDAGQPSVGEGWLMGAITAAILGGTSLRGGQGSIVGTMLGAMLLAVLANGTVLLNVSASGNASSSARSFWSRSWSICSARAVDPPIGMEISPGVSYSVFWSGERLRREHLSDLSDDLRTRAAWLYYRESMTQDQVAQELGLTRTKVLRMLAAARLDGTVQIRVHSQHSHCVELARALEKTYRLERAIVVPLPQKIEMVSEIIGAVLGEYLIDNLEENMSIGLGWGKTLSSCLPSISQQPPSGMSVVSLLGGLTRVSMFNPSEFAWRLGDRLSAESYLIAAPVFAPDERTRDALMGHPGIREVFRRSENLDMAIVSVGDLSPASTFVTYGLLEKDEMASLQQAGAIGDILCNFVNEDGEVVDHEVNRRVVSVDPRRLRSARKIVLASGGWQKVSIFKAALKSLAPHVIITDEQVAEKLLGRA